MAAALFLLQPPFSRFGALVDDHGGASFVFHVLAPIFTISMHI